MKYAVHLITPVRVKVTGIEADDPAKALEKAQNSINFHEIFDKSDAMSQGDGIVIEHVEHSEEAINCACVDPLDEAGVVLYDESVWLDHNGIPLKDGLTVIEQKAQRADDATLFMSELLDSVETLGGIADEHGNRTLADLMHLQAAILDNGFIENFPMESNVAEIAAALPSGAKWVGFISNDLELQRDVTVKNDSGLLPLATPAGVKVVSEGRHIGSVLRMEGDYAIQDEGRGNEVAHPLSRFDAPPEVGKKMDVSYLDGWAKVAKALSQDEHAVAVSINTR